MHEVILSRDAARTLGKAAPGTRRRILAALERLKTDPHSGKRLRGELEGLFSLRIGEARAVHEVAADKKAVIVHAIGPRGNIYKK